MQQLTQPPIPGQEKELCLRDGEPWHCQNNPYPATLGSVLFRPWNDLWNPTNSRCYRVRVVHTTHLKFPQLTVAIITISALSLKKTPFCRKKLSIPRRFGVCYVWKRRGMWHAPAHGLRISKLESRTCCYLTILGVTTQCCSVTHAQVSPRCLAVHIIKILHRIHTLLKCYQITE